MKAALLPQQGSEILTMYLVSVILTVEYYSLTNEDSLLSKADKLRVVQL